MKYAAPSLANQQTRGWRGSPRPSSASAASLANQQIGRGVSWTNLCCLVAVKSRTWLWQPVPNRITGLLAGETIDTFKL